MSIVWEYFEKMLCHTERNGQIMESYYRSLNITRAIGGSERNDWGCKLQKNTTKGLKWSNDMKQNLELKIKLTLTMSLSHYTFIHEKLNIYILIKKMGNLLLEFGYLCRDIQCLQVGEGGEGGNWIALYANMIEFRKPSFFKYIVIRKKKVGIRQLDIYK